MSTLKDVGIPGLGFGILHPKVKFRFVAQFFRDGEELPHGIDISKQLTAISELKQAKSFLQVFDPAVSFHFDVEDDITNRAAMALQKLYDEAPFEMRILYLDGNDGILSTAILSDVKVREIDHSELDYAGYPDREQRTKLSVGKMLGNDVEMIKENPLAFAVFTAIQNLELVTYKAPSSDTKCAKRVTCTFSNIKFEFQD